MDRAAAHRRPSVQPRRVRWRSWIGGGDEHRNCGDRDSSRGHRRRWAPGRSIGHSTVGKLAGNRVCSFTQSFTDIAKHAAELAHFRPHPDGDRDRSAGYRSAQSHHRTHRGSYDGGWSDLTADTDIGTHADADADISTNTNINTEPDPGSLELRGVYEHVAGLHELLR